jgi:hypothetical protein
MVVAMKAPGGRRAPARDRTRYGRVVGALVGKPVVPVAVVGDVVGEPPEAPAARDRS